jgi:hypothetical protein
MTSTDPPTNDDYPSWLIAEPGRYSREEIRATLLRQACEETDPDVKQALIQMLVDYDQ